MRLPLPRDLYLCLSALFVLSAGLARANIINESTTTVTSNVTAPTTTTSLAPTDAPSSEFSKDLPYIIGGLAALALISAIVICKLCHLHCQLYDKHGNFRPSLVHGINAGVFITGPVNDYGAAASKVEYDPDNFNLS